MAEMGDYSTLIDHIKSYGTWAHLTESTWAVLSNNTASSVRDDILQYLSPNSRLVVIQSANIAAWSNPLCSNEWLKKNV